MVQFLINLFLEDFVFRRGGSFGEKLIFDDFGCVDVGKATGVILMIDFKDPPSDCGVVKDKECEFIDERGFIVDVFGIRENSKVLVLGLFEDFGKLFRAGFGL